MSRADATVGARPSATFQPVGRSASRAGARSLWNDGAVSSLAIADLGAPWQIAFDEAWEAFTAGNFGIGAVLVDPSTDTVVSVGRNRVSERAPASRTIGGNFLAHAEMNAFAAMDSFLAGGLHLYTTLEPCLMCSATSIQMNVEKVHFAAHDEFFDDLDGLWEHNEYTRLRKPDRAGPLDGSIARFARLLPLAFTMTRAPESNAAIKARRDEPELATLAERFMSSSELSPARSAGSASAAYEIVHNHLTAW